MSIPFVNIHEVNPICLSLREHDSCLPMAPPWHVSWNLLIYSPGHDKWLEVDGRWWKWAGIHKLFLNLRFFTVNIYSKFLILQIRVTQLGKVKKKVKSIIWYPASIRLSIRVSDRRLILMRLYSPVDLTGNVKMIEKLVLGGTGTGDLPILSPTR